MTFKETIDAYIDRINVNDMDNKAIITYISSYMYNTDLDYIINNEKYSKDIANLQFTNPKIKLLLSQLSELPPIYYKKCILLSYIFLKKRNIETPVVTPPDVSLDPIVTRNPLSFTAAREAARSLAKYLPNLPTFSFTKPVPPSGPPSGPVPPFVPAIPSVPPSVTAIPSVPPSVTAIPSVPPSVTAIPSVPPSVTATPFVPVLGAVPPFASAPTESCILRSKEDEITSAFADGPIEKLRNCKKEREKDMSELLIIAGLLMLLDDADFGIEA